MKTKAMLVVLLAMGMMAIMPRSASALSGVNIDDTEIKIYAELGDEWIRVITEDTDDDGVLEVEGAPSHTWYRFELEDDDDEEVGQMLAVEVRMLDRKGRMVDNDTDVDVYMKINGDKVKILETETDDEGWVDLFPIFLGEEYFLDISKKDESSISGADNKVRIKVKAKLDDSDWFRACYKSTNKDRRLKVENVLPGKYKFKYKNGDATPAEPFTIKMRLRDEDGEKIKKKTKVKLYVYMNGQKVKVGEVKTDKKGWLTIPGMMTGVKYKISL